ncbi:MAG TPA: DnaJ domain-containing protein [Bryobacteraceae bacterium]|jgi:molecular chaperone HscB
MMRYYEALGLEPTLSLDLEDLKQRFYGRSRLWHPDRFTRAAPLERDRALDMTAILNDAFRILRDPVKRAEYFLKEHGIELSGDPPSELLEEVFDLNLMLEELREGHRSVRRDLDAARERFSGMLTEIDKSLEDHFCAYDISRDRVILGEIRATLNRRKYISNLVRDVDQQLNVHSPN